MFVDWNVPAASCFCDCRFGYQFSDRLPVSIGFGLVYHPIFFVGAAAVGVGVAGASALAAEVQVANQARVVEIKIRSFYLENDRAPAEVECVELLLDEDEAEMMNVTKVSETEMLIKHQGADGIFGTVDDREFPVDLDLENPPTEMDEISFD